MDYTKPTFSVHFGGAAFRTGYDAIDWGLPPLASTPIPLPELLYTCKLCNRIVAPAPDEVCSDCPTAGP